MSGEWLIAETKGRRAAGRLMNQRRPRQMLCQKETPVATPSRGWEKQVRGLQESRWLLREDAQVDSDDNWTRNLSAARLKPYQGDGAPLHVALYRHRLNLRICESLYPSLQMLELHLRNAMQRLLVKHAGANWQSGEKLRHSQACQQTLTATLAKLARRKTSVTNDDLVAALGMGFWTALMDAHYENASRCGVTLWPHGIKDVFPGLPKSLHSRRRIKGALDRLRQLRNRVFHHERIVHWQDLDDQVQSILNHVQWMHPAGASELKALSRYHLVRGGGS